MKTFKKITAVIITVMLMTVMFAGCAKKADNVSSSESAVDKIKKAGKITMLTNAAFAPFEYLDKDGNVAGVDVEICQAVADELGVKLEVIDMDFDGIITAIQTDKGDLGAAGITANDERRKSVNFSVNYVDTGIYIVVKKDNSDIASPDDLVGKQIGVQLGTTSDLFVSDVKDAEVMRYKTTAEAAMALSNGQLDAVVCDELPAKDILASNDSLKMLDEPLTVEQYAIAIKQENTDLADVVNKVLSKMLDDGTIDALVAKHMDLANQSA